MTKAYPSTFQLLDRQFPIKDDQRYSVYAIRHFSVPFTILADIIIGVAHLIFLSVRQELTQKDFWEISHEYFFVYPFQQLAYFLFSSFGTLMTGNYFEGYREGQSGVMNASNEIYQGPPRIFNHIIGSFARPQYFPGIALTDRDRFNLKNLVIHTSKFQALQQKLRKGSYDNDITKAEFIYQVFYEKPPLSIYTLKEKYDKKCEKIPTGTCEEHLGWEREALTAAKDALEAFFALPSIVRNHLNNS